MQRKNHFQLFPLFRIWKWRGISNRWGSEKCFQEMGSRKPPWPLTRIFCLPKWCPFLQVPKCTQIAIAVNHQPTESWGGMLWDWTDLQHTKRWEAHVNSHISATYFGNATLLGLSYHPDHGNPDSTLFQQTELDFCHKVLPKTSFSEIFRFLWFLDWLLDQNRLKSKHQKNCPVVFDSR